MSTVVKKTKRNKSGLFYSKKEEYINSFSHIAGAVGCIAACGVYLQRCYAHGDKWAVAGMWLMLAGMLFSYLSSSVYHSLKHHNPLKKRFRQFDHAAIYWHIAGCYSPITLTVLREQGAWGWSLFAFVWLCTIAGTIVSFRDGDGLVGSGCFQTIVLHFTIGRVLDFGGRLFRYSRGGDLFV